MTSLVYSKIEFEYVELGGCATFVIEESQFTNAMARKGCDLLGWEYSRNDYLDIRINFLRRYALIVMTIAAQMSSDVETVMTQFHIENEETGKFYKIDGSQGIKLIDVKAIDVNPEAIIFELAECDENGEELYIPSRDVLH